MRRSCGHLVRVPLFLVLLIQNVALSTVSARADRLELVRYTNLWTDSPVRSADASGITYLPGSGHLLIADSEISEYGTDVDPATGARIFTGVNVFEASLDLGVRVAADLASPADPDRREPVGIVYNPADEHVYVTDDDQKRIYRYPFRPGRRFGAPVASARTSFDGRYTDPEGITCDPRSGELFVSSGTREERVLVFRFDAATDTFTFVRDFSIAEHIHDPEGIGLDPRSRHLFLVSGHGIAEFTQAGDFIQFFDFSFLRGTGVALKLPGGLTFAPSSDPNDAAEIQSLYVTCRGVDNGKFPQRNSLDGGTAEIRLLREPRLGHVLRVPDQYATLQDAVDAAAEGDTVLVAPGVYAPVDLKSKCVCLLSRHYLSGDDAAITTTIIDAGDSDFAVRVGAPENEPEVPPKAGSLAAAGAAAAASGAPADGSSSTRGAETADTAPMAPTQAATRPLIWGFTLRGGHDGITASAPFDLLHCHVTAAGDGLDYEGGGGTVRFCRFDHNRDDAIDLDRATAACIDFCELVDNGDDAIEIRLHPYSGADTLDILIRDNLIARNGEDGIQLIGYDQQTARRFRIQGNRIIANAKAGIGMMPGANTREDCSGAPLPEQVLVLQNTFVDNPYHLVGGARVLVVNNIFTGADSVALRRVTGTSRIKRNLLWGNAGNEVDDEDRLSPRTDPRFTGADCALAADSPAIDRGLDQILWDGRTWLLAEPAASRGSHPDLGAVEWWIGQ